MTQCTTITGAGRSAVAVVAIRGTRARDIVASCFDAATKTPFSPSQIRYGVWRGPRNENVAGESVVVTPLCDEHFEVHCHGGPAATARVIEDLAACDAEPIESDRWTLNTEPLLIHEAHQVLTRCLTARTAAIAMDQVRGAMQVWATNALTGLDTEAMSVEAANAQAKEICGFAKLATRLSEPLRVVLLGPPNVGKSSLMNAIVGFDRSITFDAAGTTRDVLHADTVIGGLPIRLTDTAGIRSSSQPIEKQGVERARIAAEEADLLISVAEPDRTGISDFDPICPSKPRICVMNKSDLLGHGNDSRDRYDLATNALTGEGIGRLLHVIAETLGRWMPPPAAPVPINARQAGLLREITSEGDREYMAAKIRELLGVGDAAGGQL